MASRVAIGAVAVVGTVIALVIALVIVLAATGLLHLYRVPSSAMEPTLRCPRPNVGCEGSTADRIISLRWPRWSPARGDIVALHTPPLAVVRCGAGGVFVKRVIGLPGERLVVRSGFVCINGKRQPQLVRLASLGDGAAQERHRQDRRHLLAARTRHVSLIGRLVALRWPAAAGPLLP